MKHASTRLSRRSFLAGTAAATGAMAAGSWSAAETRSAGAAAARPYVLHFAQPASKWPDALPVGNGRLGAMVFGGVAKERIQLNEESIWDGEPHRNRVNPGAAAAIPRMRELLFAGKIAEAEALALTDVFSLPRRMPCYQTLGDLHLEFPDLANAGQPANYRLELDLDQAIVTTTFDLGGVSYRREVFVSAPDQAVVMRFSANRPGKISVRAQLDRPHSFTTARLAPNRLALDGQALPVNDNPGQPTKEHQTGVRFHAQLWALNEGGAVHAADPAALSIDGADAVTLLLDCATSYRYPLHTSTCCGVNADVLTGDRRAMRAAVERNLGAASARSYAALSGRHVADYRRYFRRVDVSFGPDAHAETPTDVRVNAVKGGAEDLALLPIYLQFGRYTLISSSRPGTLAANLQGIWNESVDPPWGSKYTININTQMNYWFAESANLSDCHLPLFDLVDATVVPGRETAKAIYGAKGSVVHHNTDLWGDAGPIDALGGGIWAMGANWLALHYWLHYAYTGDRQFLRGPAWSALRERVLFVLDYLVRDPRTGEWSSGPSCSPENAYIAADGKRHNLCMNPTMDLEIIRALMARFVEAAAELGPDLPSEDAPLVERARRLWQELPGFKIAHDGRLQEWPEDFRENEPGHRHISHLFALFPENQITVDGTPELARAARLVLDKRLAAGGGSTGWSRAWIINCFARLRDGAACADSVWAILRQSTRTNLLDLCGVKENSPFQIDGNLGGPSGLIEMMLQSQGETPLQPPAAAHRQSEDPINLHLLPAMPDAWQQGSFRGLRARGGLEVSATWQNGRLHRATLAAQQHRKVRLILPHGQTIASLTSAGKRVRVQPLQDNSGFLFEVATGRRYDLVFA